MALVNDPSFSFRLPQSVHQDARVQGVPHTSVQFSAFVQKRLNAEPQMQVSQVSAQGLMSSGTDLTLEAKLDRIEKREAFLHDMIEATANRFRDNFEKLGLPIIDIFRLKYSNGMFQASGWGQSFKLQDAYPISHPQEKYLEAAMNGSIPEFEEFAKGQKKLLDDQVNIHAELRELSAEKAELMGYPPPPNAGDAEGIEFVFGVEVSPELLSNARDYAREHPDDYAKFKEDLGADLKMMTSKQALQRYYFKTVTMQEMPELFRQFFDEEDFLETV